MMFHSWCFDVLKAHRTSATRAKAKVMRLAMVVFQQ